MPTSRPGSTIGRSCRRLWYHDHRLDFTAPNVYAGLSGFYLLFDELDSGNERDTNPAAFRLPSGRYDIPLILHDVQFDRNGQATWDFMNPEPDGSQLSPLYTVNGMLGDRFTVNRIIQPHHRVEARKYRLRILNGGPSRFYELYLQRGLDGKAQPRSRFIVLSTEGNLLPEPIEAESIQLAVAQRHDVIVDFSAFRPGDHVYLVNRLQMREDGAGPDGRLLDRPDLIMRFEVERSPDEDVSRVPDRLRRAAPDRSAGGAQGAAVRLRLYQWPLDHQRPAHGPEPRRCRIRAGLGRDLDASAMPATPGHTRCTSISRKIEARTRRSRWCRKNCRGIYPRSWRGSAPTPSAVPI